MIATLENTLVEISQPLPLPPTPRDLEVYEFVAVQSKSTREAAGAFGISQTRVRQVLSRVVEFLVQVLPGSDDEQSESRRLAVAQWAAGARLDHLYHEAMEMWRKSQQATLTLPVGLGKVCYLNQAMRIAVAAAKVPAHYLPEVPAVDALEQQPAANPPVRDCSANAESRVIDPVAAPQPQVATAEPETTYRALEEIRADVRRRFLRPAQTNDKEPALLPEGVETDALNPPMLSRHERRRQARRMARVAASK